MAVKQGDIYWVSLDEPNRSEPGIVHPHVVIQDNVLNRSRINTLVVCALTTNMKRAKSPGNVLLEVGEANLPKQSIVVVSQVSTVNKSQLGAVHRVAYSGADQSDIGRHAVSAVND